MSSPRPAIASQPFPPIRGPEELARILGVGAETAERLRIYAETLALWQKRINLVAPSTLPDVWRRHLADSAQILPLAPPCASTWIDLGSGAGFPGLVIAILLAERQPVAPCRITLVDSDQRKCAFLGEIVRRATLPPHIAVDILCMRIELATTQARLASADVVSARALAPLEKLLELANPLLGPSSCALFMKGRGVEAELEAAERRYKFSYDLVPSRTETDAGIVVVHGPAVRAEG